MLGYGSTQAIVYPTATAKRKQTFMLFAYPTGVQGNVVSAGVNEFIIDHPKDKQLGVLEQVAADVLPKLRKAAVKA